MTGRGRVMDGARAAASGCQSALSVLITISHRLFLLRIRESFGIHSALNGAGMSGCLWERFLLSWDPPGGIYVRFPGRDYCACRILWEGFMCLLSSVGRFIVTLGWLFMCRCAGKRRTRMRGQGCQVVCGERGPAVLDAGGGEI